MQEPVGIIDVCTYFPSTCVDIEHLERHDGVSTGRYKVGLGQNHMTFVTDREDVVSLAMTAVHSLLANANVPYSAIGRLDVGTETVLDRSKSIKTRLMQLFEAEANYEVEGLDCTNGCYGGTAALFNAAAWLQSDAWNGRLAVVVCADIAVYAPGAARATGGAGATAMLIGKGDRVCLALEHRLRATHMENTHDFFKPNGACEYPVVDGAATVECYNRGIDRTYALWKRRASEFEDADVTVRNAYVDFVLLHTPFNKMVKKAVGRMLWHDMEHGDAVTVERDKFFDPVRHWLGDPEMESCRNREATKAFEKLGASTYTAKAEPGAWLARETGNMYTASLYSSLNALLVRRGASLVGKRILLYSFGSGMAASMFSMRVVKMSKDIGNPSMLKSLLSAKRLISAEEYTRWMSASEKNWNRTGYEPTYECSKLVSYAYYLDSVQPDGRRVYDHNSSTTSNGVRQHHQQDPP